MRFSVTGAFNAKLFHEDLRAAIEEQGGGATGATKLAAEIGISYNTLGRAVREPIEGMSAQLLFGFCRALNLAPERYLVSGDPAAGRRGK